MADRSEALEAVNVAPCAAALVLVASIGASGCGERQSAFYATHAEAIAAGSVARGWIPDWVPVEAINIREIHDQDTNEVCLRFELPASARGALFETMHPLAEEEIKRLPASCSLRPSWWFAGLIQQSPADDGALYADLYSAMSSASRTSLLVAADTRSTSIYAWSR